MIKKFLALVFPVLSGCSYTFEHREFTDCVAESGGMKFTVSVRSTYSDKRGTAYYGEPYEIRIGIGSKYPIRVESMAVVLTDSDGEYSRSYQGALKKVSQSNGYYAWYVISDEYLPYEDISISASASGEEAVVKFECKLRTDYKKYEKSYLESVWGGV
tara:strand:+ start:79 stop:552 length:474 start_codon:yes stop_codon:yes gene_type:complete